MQFENPITFVRSIKGAPASILIAFLFCRRAMTALELQEWTGYKGDNLTVALRLLVNLGWLAARSARGPWCLVDGWQLPLMGIDSKVDSITRGESDLIGFSPTTTTRRDIKPIVKDSVVVAVDTNPIKSELQTYLEEMGVPVEENLKACRRFGIGEPMATQISEMKHVTPDFIEAHIRSLVQGETKGLAIVRIRSDELPRMWQDEIDDLVGVNYYEYKTARKTGSTWAEWVNGQETESEEG